jgi:predicted enzyme related to lactoylglutathione lyase
MSARLYRVILPVSDIDQAAEFYGQLLDQPGFRISSGRHYFHCGGTILACFDPQADGRTFETHPNGEVYYYSFAVNDLEAVFERAKTAG